jgi:hypothetical protein
LLARKFLDPGTESHDDGQEVGGSTRYETTEAPGAGAQAQSARDSRGRAESGEARGFHEGGETTGPRAVRCNQAACRDADRRCAP